MPLFFAHDQSITFLHDKSYLAHLYPKWQKVTSSSKSSWPPVSFYACSGHIKTKANGFSRSPTEILGREKTKQNKTQLTEGIPTLALVFTFYYQKEPALFWGVRKLSAYFRTHTWTPKYTQLLVTRLKVKKLPPFQLKPNCNPKSFPMREPLKIEFVSTCWHGRTDTQLPRPPQATSKEQMLQDIFRHMINVFLSNIQTENGVG